MKIILLEREEAEPVNIVAQSRLIADSAMLHTGRPLFLPDFSDAWSARIYPVYRISRLGKTIKPKFAHRYYDAVSLALRLVPDRPIGSAVDFFFDNCLAIAPFSPIEEAEANNLSLEFEGETFRHDEVAVNEAISQISRYSTLKNGDLILIEYKSLPIKIERPADFSGSIFGNKFSVFIR